MKTNTKPKKMKEQSSNSLSLFVFIDAFGYELSKRYAFLDDVLDHKQPLNTVFGYSSTCDPTILTGCTPREHGHFSCFYYDEKESPFRHYSWFDLIPGGFFDRGRIRGYLSRFMKKLHGYTGYFQLYTVPFKYLRYFNYSEKKSLFEPGGIINGQPTIFDWLIEQDIPHVMAGDVSRSEPENLKLLRDELKDGQIPFAYCFLPHLDAVLHQYGTEAPQSKQHIDWLDQQLRDVLDIADEAYDEVRLFVFSDHGMTDVHDTCDLVSQVEQLGLEFGEDYVAMYDSSMARFWFLKDGAREKIVKALEAEPKGDIVSEELLASHGVDFKDAKYGDLFYLMKPGILINPSFMGKKPLAGMHGYAPDDKDSTAVFMSNVDLENKPDGLADLFFLMKDEAMKSKQGFTSES